MKPHTIRTPFPNSGSKYHTLFIHNKPSEVKVDYQGYEINKDEAPAWIVFPWEEWDK